MMLVRQQQVEPVSVVRLVVGSEVARGSGGLVVSGNHGPSAPNSLRHHRLHKEENPLLPV